MTSTADHPSLSSTFAVISSTILLLLMVAPASGGRSDPTTSPFPWPAAERDSLLHFLEAVDPEGVVDHGALVEARCCSGRVVRDTLSLLVTEIRLERMNLSGTIDADPLCELRSLRVLSLAGNRVTGTIPSSLSKCTGLSYLNLSSNLLHGTAPGSLQSIETLDISNNKNLSILVDSSSSGGSSNAVETQGFHYALPFALVAFLTLLVIFMRKKCYLAQTINKGKGIEEAGAGIQAAAAAAAAESHEDLDGFVFFSGEKSERFTMSDLLDSAAHLEGYSICSSLYKVTLKSAAAVYAVKRLKKLALQARAGGDRRDLKETMMWVGRLKHPNLLPLVAYHSSSSDAVLLVYRFQRNRSLSHLMSDYIDKKKIFPWRQRLSIASGVARVLDYLANTEGGIPHGNLKPSNILLSDNGEVPLISEYGVQPFLDPKWEHLQSHNVHRAPETRAAAVAAATHEADVYSFGVLLLELLTGRSAEKGEWSLTKWVMAKVREEWTGEVFDREVKRSGNKWAFPLLDVALQCVSQSPEQRPSISYVLEKIENVVREQQVDFAALSPGSSFESDHDPKDGDLVLATIPEVGETPTGSSC